MAFSLDFSLLPVIDRASIFTGLDRKLDRDMAARGHLAESLGRARGAAMLFHQASGEQDSWRNEAFIRGGLADFSSMEDALARDLKAAGLQKPVQRIRNLPNPLLHLMALLRNINIHAASLSTSTHSTDILFPEDDPKQYKIDIVIITDLTVQQLLKKRGEEKNYKRQDLERAVDWFNDKQRVFGAPHLLVRGVEMYCRELLVLY